jgi:hypothetical protein
LKKQPLKNTVFWIFRNINLFLVKIF